MADRENDRIERTVDLKAPPSRVWQALTDHREFGAWFRVDLDGPFVVGEVSVGRMTYPGHEGAPWRATVRAMEPQKRFAFSWAPGAEAGAEGAPRTLVEFTLEPTAEGTRLTVVESGFAALPEGRRLEAMRGNEEGWRIQMENVRAHVD